MSRFSRLEFGNNSDRELRQNIVKDELYYFKMAKAAFESGQFEGALRNFAKVLEFNSGNTAAWTGQVRALIELGEFYEAKLWGEKAAERFDNDPELLAARAVALARLHDSGAALAFSDASIEQRGETPYVWISRGDVLLAREERRAQYCFDKALSLAPQDWVVRWTVSRVFAFYKKFAIALQYAKDALNLNPASAVIWLQVGQCEFALGLNAPAEHSFRQAVQLDPSCGAAEAGLKQVQRGDGLLRRLRSLACSLFQKS